MKITMAERHLSFLGSLHLCGTSHMQMRLIRTAVTRGVLHNRKIPTSELKEKSYNYYELDDKTIFYLIFHDRKEADSMEDAARMFSRYCGGGMDIIESMVSDMDAERLSLDEILDIIDTYVAGKAE